MADIMEFIHSDVFGAAVEVVPARRATLNQRKQNPLFIYRYSPFMRVSAVVIFLHLFMSGDVELHPGPQDQLTIGNLKTVKKAVWSARTKWKVIGLELDIIQTDLDAIEVAYRTDIERCFIEMLALWLKKVDPPPTWTAMVAALQDPTIGEGELAKELESKFVHPDSNDATDAGPAPKRRRVHSEMTLEDYAKELKSRCKAKAHAPSDDTQWPPPVDDKHKVFRLEIVEAKQKIRRRGIESDWARCITIGDKVDKVVCERVPIELKDIFSKIEGQPNVLMEGAPGSGKSTLSFHIRHEWAKGELFQDYKLVILIRLRDLIVHNAKSVADLLQGVIREVHVAEEIMASEGEGILFILDGWDELPVGKLGHSVILDLIKGDKLWKSSIITTSRPTSSAKLHEHVSLRAEILGFSKSELRSYFSFCLKDKPKDVDDLLKRIKNNPIIEGICYLPLNASILVHLFICGNSVLPNTQYGIFSDLICNCIYRYLRRTQPAATDIPKIKSLSKLPQSVKSDFQQLCELAYDGIMKDEVVFHLEQPDFVTLDLLQKVESFDRYGGTSYSYNFLHLSIQELLAAYHIATKLTDDDQAEKFKDMYNNPRFSAVFQFYAAITKLKTPEIKDVVVQVAKGCAVDNPNRTDKALLLSLLHCLYEAQDSSLCKLVADQLELKLKPGDTTLSQAECFSLQYFLKHLENFDVDLNNCYIDGDKCKALFKPDQVYPIKSLDLWGNSLGNEGAHIVSEAMKTMKNLQHLNLFRASIGDMGMVDILSVVKTMTTLQSLDIGENSIEAKGRVSIAEAMGKTPNLQQFKLGLRYIGREAALCVLTAMKTMATLPCMDLSWNSLGEDGAAALCEILKTMSNLHYLHLRSNQIGSEGGVALSEALRGMTNLQHLDLYNNKIGSEGGVALSEALRGMTNFQHLNLTNNQISSEGGVALSEALRGMTNLQHLDLGSNAISTKAAVALSVAMETMSNLQYLNLRHNDIDDEGAVAISSSLMKMSSLQTLDLFGNPIGDRGAEGLAMAMKTMNLQTLYFGGEGSRCSHKGAMMVLAAIRTMSNMKELGFQYLPLGDDGAKAFLESVKVMPNLQTLYVDDMRGISEVGEQALEEAKELVEARSKN